MKLANLISISRIFFMLLNLAISSFISPFFNSLFVFFVYSLDLFDGIVARRRGSVPFGEFVDIMIDRVITLSYFAFHLHRGMLPFWFFFFVLVRDLIVDYVFYFRLISGGGLERHRSTRGMFYTVYTSRASRALNGFLQVLIAAWGFFCPVPLWVLILFLANSYIRAFPNFIELWRKV